MSPPQLRAEVRDEIVRLRQERLTFREIAEMFGVDARTVRLVCAAYFGDRVARAAEMLKREINLARAEAHTSPPFHPPEWS